jgi:hypothetical protein
MSDLDADFFAAREAARGPLQMPRPPAAGPLTGVLRARIGQRREDRSRQASLEAPRLLLSGLTPPVFYYPGGFPFAGDYARDNPVYHVHVDSP